MLQDILQKKNVKKKIQKCFVELETLVRFVEIIKCLLFTTQTRVKYNISHNKMFLSKIPSVFLFFYC